MTLEFRRITILDVQALVELALASLPPHPTLVVDRNKVRNVVAYFAARQDQFQMAAFRDGVPVAGLAALAQDMPYHKGCEATVMFCYSTVPGAGMRLWRMLMRWVAERADILRLTWAQNQGFDERIARFAHRLGFQSAAPVLTFHKG